MSGAKRVLVLSVSAGAGHVRAADAVCAAAMSAGAIAEHYDVMDFVAPAFRALYADFYVKLVEKHPSMWAMLYRILDRTPPRTPMARMRRAIERLNTLRLRKAIATFAPDAIVCTHFLPAELLMRERARGRVACPVFVVVTDFDIHGMWIVPDMAGYFVANDEVAFRAVARGVEGSRVRATGIPIMPAFAATPSRERAATALGLDAKRTTILLMGGGAGLGRLDDVAESLLALGADFQLIALAGRNEAMRERLEAIAARQPGRLLAHGFTPHVETLMAACDLVITKPGGLTTSECLAMGLPMIVHAPIPGQEERNCDHLLEQGAALKAIDASALAWRVRDVVAHPEKLIAMAERARRIGRPDAARDVVAAVLGAG